MLVTSIDLQYLEFHSTMAFLESSAALRPLSSGMLCCFSKAKSMKGCCFFCLLKPSGEGVGAVGGVGEKDDEEAIIEFRTFVLSNSDFQNRWHSCVAK